MDTVTELMRLPSPAPKPQSIAHDGERLWMGSIATSRLYTIDPHTWVSRDEAAAPGKPWGMTVVGDELRVIVGETDEDNRYVRRFVPGHGFKKDGSFRAPDDTGSQLSYDGDWLYISQWYNQKIIAVDERGAVIREIPVPHGICGQTIVGGRFYVLTTDDEENGDYWLTRVDARGDTPICEDLAIVPFRARALAFDGERFWSNHREADQIVAFARPDA
ncbi:MAG TPA: hypothetical protein VGN14_14720 [Candidatus Elarobacter sp.]